MLKKMIFAEMIVIFIIVVCMVKGDEQRKSVNQDFIDGEMKMKKVAITFDDGPSKYTDKLLDGLIVRNVKATFFVIGENIEFYPDSVKREIEEGHLVGNHTYTHVQLSCISHEKAISEIVKTNEVIEKMSGQTVMYIRPPYGDWPKRLEQEISMKPILWDVDPRDWSVQNEDKVVCHVVNNVEDGDIILLHDIFDTSVNAALRIIDILEQEGYVFVRVDELQKNTTR